MPLLFRPSSYQGVPCTTAFVSLTPHTPRSWHIISFCRLRKRLSKRATEIQSEIQNAQRKVRRFFLVFVLSQWEFFWANHLKIWSRLCFDCLLESWGFGLECRLAGWSRSGSFGSCPWDLADRCRMYTKRKQQIRQDKTNGKMRQRQDQRPKQMTKQQNQNWNTCYLFLETKKREIRKR